MLCLQLCFSQALVEFFHAEGEGLSLEDLRNEDYKVHLIHSMFKHAFFADEQSGKPAIEMPIVRENVADWGKSLFTSKKASLSGECY